MTGEVALREVHSFGCIGHILGVVEVAGLGVQYSVRIDRSSAAAELVMADCKMMDLAEHMYPVAVASDTFGVEHTE